MSVPDPARPGGGTPAASRSAAAGLRVLFLNWRDSGHPEAGGAEVFVTEVSRRLADQGAEVQLFSARAPGQPERETVDGVQTVRRGGRWTVYPQALRYLLSQRRRVDVVVDCQNGLPFFAPLVARRSTAVLLLIHHVHQDQFLAHFPRPLARIGQWLEGPASRAVYRQRSVAVVSPSTRTDVRRRLRLRGPVSVVPNGVTRDEPTGRTARAEQPTIVCVGRLVVHKRMERLLEATARLRPQHPDLVVHVVGDGPDRARLQRLSRELGLEDVVHFSGRVPAEQRDRLLESAWLTVNPSMGEGWGLGVLEAAAAGVPAVAAAVPGLRDAVVPGRTGWLVSDDEQLDDAIDRALRLLADPAEAARWSARCVSWAAGFTWDRTTERLLGVAAAERARRSLPPGQPERRRRSDLVTWAECHLPEPQLFRDRARQQLRSEDLWQSSQRSGWLLCSACDEEDLSRVVARLGGSDAAPQLATGAQLLGALAPITPAAVPPDTLAS